MSSHRAQRPASGARRRRRVLAGVTLLVAVGLVGYGLRGLWDRHAATHGGGGTQAPVASGDLDETPVPLADCKAAADEPRIIHLGSLDVSGCIVKVGTTGRQLDAPGNIHVAGWYDKSALPGDDGLSILDGHSSGRYKDGIFNRIDDFEDGSIFTVEYGDGKERRFEVTSVSEHEIADTMTALQDDATEQDANLALITCGGDYDAAHHSFDRRVVVLATSI